MNSADVFNTLHGDCEVSYVVYRPTAPISSRSPIEFTIPPSASQYINLQHTRLRVTAQLVDNENKPITQENLYPLARVKPDGSPYTQTEIDEHEKGRVCPTNLLLSSIFNQVDVYLNNIQMAKTIGSNYSYKAYIDTLLHKGSYQDEKTHLASEFYVKQSNPTSFDRNMSIMAENSRYCDGALLNLEGVIHSDIFDIEKSLISGTELKLKLYQNHDPFRVHAATSDNNFKILVSDASLSVCYTHPNSEQIIENETHLAKTPVLYPFNRSDIKVFQLAAGSYSASFDNIFTTSPYEIVIAMVKSKAYSGSSVENSYNFQHYNINFLEIALDNVSCPGAPLKPDFDAKNYTEAYMKLIDTRNPNQRLGIHYDEYAEGYTLFRFELPKDNRRGNVSIRLSFSKALPEGAAMIVYAKYNSEFKIDSERNILE